MGSVHGAVTPARGAAVSPADQPWFDEGRDDARACRLIARRHARTFSIAGLLLPREKRRAAHAIYATCRTADDIVDGHDHRREDSARALQRFREAAFDALERHSDDPILRELAGAVRTFDVPRAALHELFDGVERDLADTQYGSWTDVERYCQGVA